MAYDSFIDTVSKYKHLTSSTNTNGNKGKIDNLKSHLKKLYDYTKSEDIKNLKSDALPELIIEDFDLEQIWQQIELKNLPQLSRDSKDVEGFLKRDMKFSFFNEEEEEEVGEVNDDELVNEAASSGGSEADDTNEVDDNSIPESDDDDDEEEEEDENENLALSDDSEFDENEEERPIKKMKSIVDDDFFKLDEMEEFLKIEEKKAANPEKPDPDSDSDSEKESDDINLFEMDDDNEAVKYESARYKDFFVPSAPDDAKKTKRNKFLEQYGSDESDGDETNAREEEKSSFEKRQERIQKVIEDLEAKAVSEKPWQLKGEITAKDRPKNALLEEFVEFDLSKRPAPVITEKTTLQLEDIIKQRIKDKAFDSVVRKAKPVSTPFEYKKKLLLDQEKSKVSLAHIYEQDYLQQKAALDPDNEDKEEPEPELHKEVRSMLGGLFRKLDALSNYHFTPKPAIPEARVVVNQPAVVMEEATPVTVNEAAMLAPEEVLAKPKGELMGKSERSKTDKNRERRKKKRKQKMHANLKKSSDKEKDVKKLMNAKNVNKMKESGEGIKSSTAFFNKLEDQVKNYVKEKSGQKKKKDRVDVNIKRIKL